MTYCLIKFDIEGRWLADLGRFANIASARQAMLDDSSTADLPTEEPWHSPGIGVVEGWFVDCFEYIIEG